MASASHPTLLPRGRLALGHEPQSLESTGGPQAARTAHGRQEPPNHSPRLVGKAEEPPQEEERGPILGALNTPRGSLAGGPAPGKRLRRSNVTCPLA